MLKDSADTISAKFRLIAVLGVLLFSCLCAFRGITITPLDDHEAYVSVTAREMIANHEYAIPTMNGEPRIKKPPLQYWLVVGASKITGSIDEFTTRLPSALAAILTTAVIIYFVNRWLGFTTAVLSAMMWSTSMAFLRYAQNGRAEIALTFFTALSLLAFFDFANANTRKQQVTMALVFWISFALANLAKGPVPFLFVIPPMLLYAQINKQWNLFAKMLPLAGPVLFLAIILPWPIIIIKTLPNWAAVWKDQSIDRFVTDSKSRSIFFYLPEMVALTAPWIGFVIASLIAPFLKQWIEKRKLILFLWLWFVLGFAFMSFCGGKRRHYILPVIPPIIILCAIVFKEILFERLNTTAAFTRNFFLSHFIIISVGLVACLLIAYRSNSEFFKPMLLICIIAAVSLTAAVLFYRRDNRIAFCAVIFIGYALSIGLLLSKILNVSDEFIPLKKSAMHLRDTIPSQNNLAAYKFVPASLVYYFGRPILCADDPNTASEYYNRGDYLLVDPKYKLDTSNFTILEHFDYFKKINKKAIPADLFHKPVPNQSVHK